MRFHQAVAFLETEQLVEFARQTDDLGYSGICLSDHLFYPRRLTSRYPYSPFPDGSPVWAPETDWPDCWCLASAMAAVTRTLTFTTNVYVAPARDICTVAKAVGTAAVLSGGRVRLGVAAGWCAEEFAATGQPFANRGQRLSEMIVALRALWQPGWVEHHGRFYDLGPLQMRPVPPEPVPIYVGGHSAPALERAATLGDGFIGAQVFGVEEAVALALQVRALRADAGLPVDGYAIYVAIDRPEDLRAYPMLAEAGVTDVICAPWLVASASEDRTYRSSLAEKVDAAGRFADAVVAEVGR